MLFFSSPVIKKKPPNVFLFIFIFMRMKSSGPQIIFCGFFIFLRIKATGQRVRTGIAVKIWPERLAPLGIMGTNRGLPSNPSNTTALRYRGVVLETNDKP